MPPTGNQQPDLKPGDLVTFEGGWSASAGVKEGTVAKLHKVWALVAPDEELVGYEVFQLGAKSSDLVVGNVRKATQDEEAAYRLGGFDP